jgi:hypothetical protein
VKKLITICAAVVGLILSSACVSWAVPTVSPPPPDANAPSWWNTECPYYAYGWWEADILPDETASPLNDTTHWASNFLNNTDFTASVVDNSGVTIVLDNVYRPDYYKEIYIYVEGTRNSPPPVVSGTLDVGSSTFTGTMNGWGSDGTWGYVVSGVITPQPASVTLTLSISDVTGVTSIWAGENCVPEPATIGLLGLGALSLLRRKR